MSNIENIKFGVEIETTIPQATNIRIGGHGSGSPVSQARCPSPENPEQLHTVLAPTFSGATWRADSDGSINVTQPGTMGCEFVSPILQGEAGVQHLMEFVAWLNRIGAKVNTSCGLHFHIGLTSFVSSIEEQAKFVKILSRIVTRNATALYAQTGTLSRERGPFCKKADGNIRKQITIACRKKNLANMQAGRIVGDRYQLLNLTNIATRRTVEFRCFAGTVNIHKILCHLLSVMLLCKVAAGRKSLTNWDPSEQLSGTDSLHNLLKSRPTFKIVEAAPFEQNKKALLAAGFEMATKYDQARAQHANRAAEAARLIAEQRAQLNAQRVAQVAAQRAAEDRIARAAAAPDILQAIAAQSQTSQTV